MHGQRGATRGMLADPVPLRLHYATRTRSLIIYVDHPNPFCASVGILGQFHQRRSILFLGLV